MLNRLMKDWININWFRVSRENVASSELAGQERVDVKARE